MARTLPLFVRPVLKRGEVVTMKIAHIVEDKRFQMRPSLDEDDVRKYREVIERGGTRNGSPIRVFDLGDRKVLTDGFHWITALKAESVAEYQVELIQGTHEDALRDAALANHKHGNKTNPATIANAIRCLLDNFRIEFLDTASIVGYLDCSDALPRKVRAEWEAVNNPNNEPCPGLPEETASKHCFIRDNGGKTAYRRIMKDGQLQWEVSDESGITNGGLSVEEGIGTQEMGSPEQVTTLIYLEDMLYKSPSDAKAKRQAGPYEYVDTMSEKGISEFSERVARHLTQGNATADDVAEVVRTISKDWRGGWSALIRLRDTNGIVAEDIAANVAELEPNGFTFIESHRATVWHALCTRLDPHFGKSLQDEKQTMASQLIRLAEQAAKNKPRELPEKSTEHRETTVKYVYDLYNKPFFAKNVTRVSESRLKELAAFVADLMIDRERFRTPTYATEQPSPAETRAANLSDPNYAEEQRDNTAVRAEAIRVVDASDGLYNLQSVAGAIKGIDADTVHFGMLDFDIFYNAFHACCVRKVSPDSLIDTHKADVVVRTILTEKGYTLNSVGEVWHAVRCYALLAKLDLDPKQYLAYAVETVCLIEDVVWRNQSMTKIPLGDIVGAAKSSPERLEERNEKHAFNVPRIEDRCSSFYEAVLVVSCCFMIENDLGTAHPTDIDMDALLKEDADEVIRLKEEAAHRIANPPKKVAPATPTPSALVPSPLTTATTPDANGLVPNHAVHASPKDAPAGDGADAKPAAKVSKVSKVADGTTEKAAKTSTDGSHLTPKNVAAIEEELRQKVFKWALDDKAKLWRKLGSDRDGVERELRKAVVRIAGNYNHPDFEEQLVLDCFDEMQHIVATPKHVIDAYGEGDGYRIVPPPALTDSKNVLDSAGKVVPEWMAPGFLQARRECEEVIAIIKTAANRLNAMVPMQCATGLLTAFRKPVFDRDGTPVGLQIYCPSLEEAKLQIGDCMPHVVCDACRGASAVPTVIDDISRRTGECVWCGNHGWLTAASTRRRKADIARQNEKRIAEEGAPIEDPTEDLNETESPAIEF